jgi:hypothetical protein
MPGRPAHDARLRPVPWRRMAWVTWRQHRAELGGVAAFLGAFAVYLWLTGLQMRHAEAAYCHPGRLNRLLRKPGSPSPPRCGCASITSHRWSPTTPTCPDLRGSSVTRCSRRRLP